VPTQKTSPPFFPQPSGGHRGGHISQGSRYSRLRGDVGGKSLEGPLSVLAILIPRLRRWAETEARDPGLTAEGQVRQSSLNQLWLK